MYAWPANKYVLSGYQHDQDGNTLVQFHGDEVHLCGSKFARPCIKFEWNSSPVYERNQFSGYTFMDSGIFEKDKFEGEGFFITFHDQPKKFDLRFMKLTEHRLNKLKLDLVDISSSEARKQFVSNFHRNNADWSMSIEHVDPAL